MNVLVINAGSSSLKYQLLNPTTGELLAKGLCERIGIDGLFTYKPQLPGKEAIKAASVSMPTHNEAIQAVLNALVDEKNGVIGSMKEIDAVGHRVVHGGEKFAKSVVITDEVMQACLTYFTITALSFPFLALYNAGAAIFRSTGNSAVSMKVSVIVNGINFCGNALCVFVLKMGVAGVAVPTLISRAVGACIILALAARQDYQLRITPQSVTRFEGRTVKSILYIGIPSAFENSLFQLGRVLVVSMISLFGTVHISANAVANNLDAIGCIVGNAMGLAMITVIGRCIGAQDFEQTKYYTKKLLLWDYIAQGAVNVVVLLSLNQILSMYTLTPETRALAWTLVMIHNGMSIFLWPASFVLPNALRAANDVRFTMVVATASMLVWRMGLSWVLCVQMGMGAVGVWYAMVVDWICRIICFVARFVSGAWKKNAVKQAA